MISYSRRPHPSARAVAATLLAAGFLAACSGPMEQPPSPEEARASEGEKTGEARVPEIRDAEGVSPQQDDEPEAVLLFDPRDARSAAAEYDAAGAMLPDAVDGEPVTSLAKGSFTAPGANETAYLVAGNGDGGETGVARLVLVSIGGIAQTVDIEDAGDTIVAAPDTNGDGLTELVLYGSRKEDGARSGRAIHVGLRGAALETLATYDGILTDPCEASPEDGERTGSMLMQDEQTGEITEEPFSKPC